MATIIEQAKKGQRKAMTALYEASKQKVYDLSCLLLGSETEAADATSYAYRNIWGAMSVYGIESESDFTHQVIRKAVDYAKRKISKQNAKAFRMPQGRNFLIPSGGDLSDVSDDNFSFDVLNKLPPLQRFIFVLHTAGEYLPEEIAATFKFDVKTIGMALEAESTNIQRIAHHTEHINVYEWMTAKLQSSTEKTIVPESVDKAVLDAIHAIAAPLEKKKKKRIYQIGAAVLAVCLLVIGIFVIVSLNNGAETNLGTTGNDDSTLTSDLTSDETNSSLITEPVIDLDESLTYYADIAIEDYGTITVKLDQTAAPVTVSNFINLAQNGF